MTLSDPSSQNPRSHADPAARASYDDPLSHVPFAGLQKVVDRIGLGAPARRIYRAIRPLSDHDRYGRLDEEHMRCLLGFVLGPDSNCIDVGAYRGWVLEDMVRIAPMGRHIAYEPLTELHAELAERFPNVDVRCAALSNKDGETSFTRVVNLPSYSGFRTRPYPTKVELETITVKTERLDDHLPAGYVPQLIKIDVEGAEHLVIEGAMNTIATHRPVVVFEHGEDCSIGYGATSADIYRLLCDEAGLRMFDMDGNGPMDVIEFCAAPRWNFVAHR